MATRTHHRSHTFRPIRNAITTINELFKVALVIYGFGAVSMLVFVLYFHI